MSRLELDAPDEKGITLRSRLNQVVTSTGKIPVELLSEVTPDSEEQIIFDILYDIYSTDQSFYLSLDAYCRMWELTLTGEEISLLRHLWRKWDEFNNKKRKEREDKAKKQQSKGSTNSPRKPVSRPSRGRIR